MPSSPKPGLTRREALKGAAAATAAASCGTGGDSGTASGPGSIDTIIIVMMENRSFDHWLGARKLLEGAAEDGLTDTMSNPGTDGSPVAPYAEAAPCPSDPPHGWTSCHDQWNQGQNDGFVTEYAARNGTDGTGVMAYQTRETAPISWALADSFGVCDQYFCSVMGPTWPNRFYAHMASSEGKQDNSLPDGSAGFTEMNIWKALSAAGVDWGYYYSDLPILGLMADTWDDSRVGMVEDFYAKAEAGTLPPVVWLDPAFSYNDNHPPHHPGLGELFLASIYEALAASPQWERCLLILTYDEHGGFFDHVAPGTCQDDHAKDGFDQLGFRVPTLLIGPWVKQGAISTPFDHTSWLKMVCETHGIDPWNTRLKWATSLAEGIDQDRLARNEPLPPVALPAFDFDPETVGEECFYGQTLPRPLQVLRDHCEAQGFPYRLADRGAVVGPFVRQWKRRGLVS